MRVGELPFDHAGPLPDQYLAHNPEYRGYLKKS